MADNKKDIEEAKKEMLEEIKEENIEKDLDIYLKEKKQNKKEGYKEKELKHNKEEKKVEFVAVKHDEVKTSKFGKFLQSLITPLIDQVICLAISLVILFIIDFALRPFGYLIAEKVAMFFFIYVAANILYPSILKSTKLKGTIGEVVLQKLDK